MGMGTNKPFWNSVIALYLRFLPLFNPFHTTDLFWYPLETSINWRFSDIFRGYQKRSVAWNMRWVKYEIRWLQSHNLKIDPSNGVEVLCEKSVLRNFAKFTEEHMCQSLFFNKVAGLRSTTWFKKETLARMFSCEFCEISKNTFSHRALPVAASKLREMFL